VVLREIDAVIFDWAGTVVDFGCFAPTQIFVDAFKSAYNFDLTLVEARRPMGLGKWEHIEALSQDKEVSTRWLAQFGRVMTKEDIDHIYATFIPLQCDRVQAHSALIPGVLELVTVLKQQSCKIGSTTGYPREVMDRLVQAAALQGYQPNSIVCTGDLASGGRPGPWMALISAIELKARAAWRCVKVDDTTPGIEEGMNAGMWTVGVTLSGSLCGITEDSFITLSDQQKEALRAPATKVLKQAGAHFVIDTVADLLPVLQQIDSKIRSGQRP
jgi:phosphonoacetaldehyde hydrolase